jgi:hypothetical protein
MIVLGIDPGLSGAISVLEGDSCLCFDMPVHALSRGGKSKREVDPHGLANLIVKWASANDHAFVERVGAMPGQGVSSMFALGKGFGIILGVLAALAVPYTVVDPRIWKKALGVPAEKDGARARASQLMPKAAGQWPLKKHDGRAEAALIALYGMRKLGE